MLTIKPKNIKDFLFRHANFVKFCQACLNNSYVLTFRASLLAQMVKNLPAMQETWVRSLDWENPLEEGMATHYNILA